MYKKVPKTPIKNKNNFIKKKKKKKEKKNSGEFKARL